MTFLPPKRKAPTNKTEKLNRDKDVTEKKQIEKDNNKKTVQRRITSRNQKRIERAKKEQPAKRLQSRQNYYNKHNTTMLI